MPEVAEPSLLERFRTIVNERTGLDSVPGKTDDLLGLLHQRAQLRGQSALGYVTQLERGESAAELRELAPLLTVGETYFFRNPAQFAAFQAILREHVTRADPFQRPLRVLSAGCASGEEAYSLAIAAREAIGPGAATVVGVDLNPLVLERARNARYSEWSLRALDKDLRTRWFKPHGRDMELVPEIRAAVSFGENNLVLPERELRVPGQWDVIFCRNVLMYFSPDKARAALANLTNSLSARGHFFMGHAETLRGLSNDFHLCHTHDAFYYQRKPADAPAEPLAPRPARAPTAAAATSGNDEDWFASIDRATERVRGLSAPKAKDPQATPAPADLSRVLELMQNDRHTEALGLLSASASARSDDVDQLLAYAALLTHAGTFPAAEAACQRLLSLDELSAGAHYVLALCSEAENDFEGALRHNQVAAYLDPSFAMPHLHMGMVLRRSGKELAAQRELLQAQALLEREDATRLVMFGGGFGRAALLAMCRSDASGDAAGLPARAPSSNSRGGSL